MSLMEQAQSLSLIRLGEILKIIPVSKAAWYRGMSEGRYPEGVQLSDRTVAWRTADIVKLLENLNERNESKKPLFDNKVQ